MGGGGKKNKVYDEETALAEDDRSVCSCAGMVVADSGLLEARGKKVCGMPRACCKFFFFFHNLLCTPFLLCWHFTCIYRIPFVSILCRRVIRLFVCWMKKCKYKDLRFPATDQSIGDVDIVSEAKPQIKLGPRCLKKPKCGFSCGCFKWQCTLCRFSAWFFNPWKFTVKWKRASEFKDLEGGKKMYLFEGKIEAADVCQGALGDCWLLAALATVAEEHPDQIKSLFQTREADPCGCYQIKLFDEDSGRWRTFTIDDRIPVTDDGTPHFTAPNGNELWVLLLEKAFARMKGSYGALQGGHPSDALTAFTGNRSVTLRTQNNEGTQWSGLGKRSHDVDDMFKIMSKVLDRGMVACAGSRADGKSDKENTQGISHKHAYTVLDTHTTLTGVKLIQLRNPWGSGTWTGAYSDQDTSTKNWFVNAGLSLRGKTIKQEDGRFWMPWKDFCRLFTHVDFCTVTKSVSNMQMEVKEDMGICGPFVGITLGFIQFFLLCKGCCAMWRPHKSSTIKVLADAGA